MYLFQTSRRPFLQLGIPEAKIGVDWMHRYAGMRQYELRAISRANFNRGRGGGGGGGPHRQKS